MCTRRSFRGPDVGLVGTNEQRDRVCAPYAHEVSSPCERKTATRTRASALIVSTTIHSSCGVYRRGSVVTVLLFHSTAKRRGTWVRIAVKDIRFHSCCVAPSGCKRWRRGLHLKVPALPRTR